MQLSYKLTIQLDKNLSMKFKEGTTWITIGNYQCTEKQNSRLAVSYKRRKRQIRKKHKKCSVVFILIFFFVLSFNYIYENSTLIKNNECNIKNWEWYMNIKKGLVWSTISDFNIPFQHHIRIDLHTKKNSKVKQQTKIMVKTHYN